VFTVRLATVETGQGAVVLYNDVAKNVSEKWWPF